MLCLLQQTLIRNMFHLCSGAPDDYEITITAATENINVHELQVFHETRVR